MSISNSIADALEALAAKIRANENVEPKFSERFIMTFLSRPDPDKENYQMTGRDSFKSMDEAAKRMAHMMSYNGEFVSLYREVTVTEDVTEEMKEKLRPLVPTELAENMRAIYHDWNPPVL